MSVVKGKLRSELDTPGICGLVNYLTDERRLCVQLVDNDGEVVGAGGSCPAGNVHCEKVRDRLIRELFQTHEPCHGTCPAGATVSALPIMHSSALFGGIVVCEFACEPDRSAQTKTTTDPLISSLSSLVARDSFYELEVESLTNDLALRYEELDLLYEIGERIPIRAQTPTVIDYVVQGLKQVINCDGLCWVPNANTQWPDRSSAEKVYWSQQGPGGKELEEQILRISSEIDRRVKEKEGPVTVNDLPADPVLGGVASGVWSASGCPVATDGEHYGTLVLFRCAAAEFKSGEEMLVTAVTRRSGTVIRNARLYEELNGLFLSTIKTLVRIIEGKDAYTRGHSERVSAFSMLLGDLLHLPFDEKEALSWSSLLHDIGKIKVPEEILKKPGALTDEEFGIIQKHPGFGADMLSPISQLAHCLPDIRHHHERIDGKGYPDGLKGDDIPRRAKIIAVADTFDALTSDRCYRPKFSVEKAICIVSEVAGTQLCPDAAGALVDNKDAFLRHLQSSVAPEAAHKE